MKKETFVVDLIRNYYSESESAYRNWGKDEKRKDVYALHGDFAIEGKNLSHYEEVKELTTQLVRFAEVNPNSIILDAGCGAGALTFEIAEIQKGVKIFGVNVARNQLVSANKYRIENSIQQVAFLESDYHYLPFPDETFDIVIFCESYIHSYDKKALAREVYRIIKPNGNIVLSDTFIERSPKDEKERLVLTSLMSGWYLPSILKIEEMESILKQAGFHNISYEPHTQNIIGSSRRMREHAELRIRQGNQGSRVLELSRKATIACNEAFESGLTGYYFVRGYKL